YYRLSGPEVAQVLEVLAVISERPAVRSLRQSRQARLLQEARTCYDHLAGRVGVELYDALQREGHLVEAGDAAREGTSRGRDAVAAFGVDLDAVRRRRRRFAPPCLDWLERRPHLGGALGAAMFERMVALEWLVRGTTRRVIEVTAAGRAGLE